jgi:hypothetical protein
MNQSGALSFQQQGTWIINGMSYNVDVTGTLASGSTTLSMLTVTVDGQPQSDLSFTGLYQ